LLIATLITSCAGGEAPRATQVDKPVDVQSSEAPTPMTSEVLVPPPVPTVVPAPATATPGLSDREYFRVGNTGGEGVYIRRSPVLADRLRAWPDGTRLESLNEPTIGDGTDWLKVRDPDGNI